MAWAIAILVALVCSLFASPARADDACVSSDWVLDCARTHATPLEITACPPGALVVRAPSADLSIEIVPVRATSFRKVGGVGLSPVGEFADWNGESDARKRALDALAECASRAPPRFATLTPDSAGGLRPVRPPWLLVAAFALLFGALQRGRRAPALGRDALLAVGLGACTFIGRSLAIPRAFFHQNGQGPSFVGYALRDDLGLLAYGPGFAEVFGAPARLAGAHPENGVWLAQSLLAASAVTAIFVAARRMGARPALATGIAILAALDPLAARLAESESYFGAIASLSALALGACSLAEPRTGSRFVLALGSAALFAAQAVRIHPIAWPVLVFTPLPLLFAPGPLRRRGLVVLAGVAIVVALVALTSGHALFEVAHGSLGRAWLPRARPRWELLGQKPVPLALVLALAAGASLRSWRGAVLALAAAALIVVTRLTDLLSDPNPAVTGAHARMFAPAFALLLAAWSGRLMRSARASALSCLALSALGLVEYRVQARQFLLLPTDALEARFVIDQRARLEPNAVVASLERAGARVDVLPLYEGVTARRLPLRAGDALPRLGSLPGPAYYLHSTLCSSPEGRAACDELERGASLELVADMLYPARPSMRWQPYDSDPVRVALYRVRTSSR